ncbi:hypothetical protein [Streptomyces collinus]|uniref:hypothetical protein n=1 Tax=Streptomyces collinus TaxID=42684 RepID=UPI00381DFEAB
MASQFPGFLSPAYVSVTTETTSTGPWKRTLWNHSGPGTTATSGDGSKIYKFKACDENNGDPDDCASNWTIR